MNFKENLLWGIMAIVGIYFILWGAFSMFTNYDKLNSYETTHVDCFDKHNNKILGSVCEQRHLNQEVFGGATMIGFGVAMCIIWPLMRKSGGFLK